MAAVGALVLLFVQPLLGAEAPTDGTDSDALLKQAVQAFQAGRGPEALRLADQILVREPAHLRARLVRGRILAEVGESARSVRDFEEFIRLGGAAQQPSVYHLLGVERFRLADPERSVTDFDEFLKRQPEQAAHHWQRGISCYYARQFEAGRRQFELHQTVNRHDVENAVWHYLCLARIYGVARAREQLIPITGDSRVPMAEVHGLFAGRVRAEEVLAAATRGEASAETRRDRLFYAHLYLGLYHEAQDERPKAREHIREAALTYASRHYMGEVARVHWKLLEQGWDPAGKAEPAVVPGADKPRVGR